MTAAEQLPDPFAMPTGTIVLRQGHDRYTVKMAGGAQVKDGEQCVAKRAASCLLVPQPGDRVLLGFAPEAYVLAVLDRKPTHDTEIVLEGDARVSTPTGRLDLSGAGGVSLTTPETISLFGERLRARAKEAKTSFENVELVATRTKAAFEELAVVAREYDGWVDRLTHRAKRVYRAVTEFEQLRAKHFDYRADETAQVKGKNAVVVAREVIKIDGEQVHVG